MKDYHHIDELIRQKFEGFEPAPPESVWEKVRTQIGPDGPAAKSSPITLPIITGLIILVGLLGLFLLINRLEATMPAQAGTGDLRHGHSPYLPVLDTHQQVSNASSTDQNISETNPSSPAIPVREPFDGKPASAFNAFEEQQDITSALYEHRFNKVRKSKKQTERFSGKQIRLEGKNFTGELDFPSGTQEIENETTRNGFDPVVEYLSPVKPKWDIGFHFNPEVSFYPQDNISNILNYGLQVMPRISVGDWYLQSGLGFRFGGDQGNYLINYNKYLGSYEDVYEVTFDTSGNNVVPTYHTQNVDVYDTVGYYSISETKVSYAYMDFPILFGRQWNFSKISLFVNAGPSLSVLLGRSSPQLDYPEENIRILNENPQIPARESINWQLIAGAGFRYRLGDRASFSLEPTFRYYLSNDFEKTGLNTRHPYSFGIRAGLIYHIKF